MEVKKAKIGNALTSSAANHVVAVSEDIYDELKGRYQSDINEDAVRAKIVADKAAADIGADSTTLLQGGIDAGGSENSSSYFLRTGRYSTFKLEVNDGYTIGQVAQYDLAGNFVALYSDYTQMLEGIEWIPQSVVATDKEYMWVAVIFKGNSPTTAISPREAVVKTFVSGLHYYMQGGESDPQSAASQAKMVVDRSIEQLPNEEDLVLVDEKMQLANRAAAVVDGKVTNLGYVILRKDKSFSEQVTAANTIYEIRYNFDLGGATVTLKEGCTLKFVGGKLSNGTVNGTSTLLSGQLVNILDNTVLKGTWENLTCNLDWWGAKIIDPNKDDTTWEDSTIAIDNAFRSSIYTVEVSGRYCIKSPILLPYNKIIKGRSGSNNTLTGFFAGGDFQPAVVEFAARYGKEAFTQKVYGMFYHRDTTKLEMHDLTIDARYKAQYCIEHIDMYGSCDLYNMYISNALLIGVLQYGCENPHFEDTYITGCHIGLVCSVRRYGNYVLEDDTYNTTAEQLNALDNATYTDKMGEPNIVVTDNLRTLYNNYGCVFHGCFDVRLSNLETAHNAIAGISIQRAGDASAQKCTVLIYGAREKQFFHFSLTFPP